MARQAHDIGVQKRARREDTLRKRREKRPSRYANWCRTRGHDPSCSCVYGEES